MSRPDAKSAAMVEVNCETDFVAKNEDFRAFAAEVAQIVARDNPADVAALGARTLASGESVEARRTALVQKIGENLSIRRIRADDGDGPDRLLRPRQQDRRAGGSHRRRSRARQGSSRCTSRRASRWPCRSDGVPADVVRAERTISRRAAADSGKPANIVEKMVEGAVAKFLAEVTLLGQPFVKGDDKQTVGELVKSQGAVVHDFVAVRRRRGHREEERRFRRRGGGDDQGVIPLPPTLPPQPERSSPP